MVNLMVKISQLKHMWKISLIAISVIIHLSFIIKEKYLVDFHQDNHGFTYTYDSTGTITKFQNTKAVTSVNFKSKQTLYSLQASNALNILLFYKEQQEIILLDNFLNQLQAIDLTDFNFTQVELATLSNDNKIWLLTAPNNNLIKVDFQGNIIQTIEDLTLLNLQLEGAYKMEMIDDDLVIITKTKIHYFDPNGIWSKTQTITSQNLSITSEKIAVLQGDSVHLYRRNPFLTKTMSKAISPNKKKIQLTPKGILYLNKNGVNLIELP